MREPTTETREKKDTLAKKIALDEVPYSDLKPLARKIVALLPGHETLTLHRNGDHRPS